MPLKPVFKALKRKTLAGREGPREWKKSWCWQAESAENRGEGRDKERTREKVTAKDKTQEI